MCGIIGITSSKPVSSAIINSLRKLEYRGYDSAGIATLSNGAINEVKSEGRVDNLEKNLAIKSMMGVVGIGHVRWATHGVPNAINAHPLPEDYGTSDMYIDNRILTEEYCKGLVGEVYDVCVCGLPWESFPSSDGYANPKCGCGYQGLIGGLQVTSLCFSGGNTMLVFFSILIG